MTGGFEVRREAGGRFLVVLSQEEASVLESLPSRLRRVLDDPGASGRLIDRLFPRAYRDPKEEAEYRQLLGSDLLEQKRKAITAFEATLSGARRKRRKVEISIRPEEFDLWLGFVNDMRLVLATALDVEDESFWRRPVEDSGPHAREVALLHYLSWLEEMLIAAASEAG